MSQNVGTTLDYLTQIEPPAITIVVFTRNGSDRTRFSKFHCQRLPRNGEAVGHLWLFPGLENINFCYYCKLFSSGYPLAQHSIPLVSAGTTLVPPFRSGRYLAREEVLMRVVILWFMGFNSAVPRSLCWRGLGITLRASLCNITDFYHYAFMHPSKISTHHRVGLRRSVSNWAPHLLTSPALVPTIPDTVKLKELHSTSERSKESITKF